MREMRDMVALKYKIKSRNAHRNNVRDTVALEAQDVRGSVHVADQETCFHLKRQQELMWHDKIWHNIDKIYDQEDNLISRSARFEVI